MMEMFDTLATAQTLKEAGIEPSHAEAITTAVNQSSEQVTRADLCSLEVRLVKWIIIVAGLQTAVVFGIIRFFH